MGENLEILADISSHLSSRLILIATMHGKEKVIGPLLENGSGIRTGLIEGLDTDKFGTFSGEIPRKDSPVETLRKKIEAAREVSGHPVIVGSEGSFGSHPAMFMLPANEEWVMLRDFERGLEIIGRHLTEETNFGGEALSSLEELDSFCERSGFPSHSIILKLGESEGKILKDLNKEELYTITEDALKKGIIVKAETDMRADRNPTRLRSIGKATANLIERLKSVCPECQLPGYWITKVIPGLPCKLCGSPTNSIKSYVYSCRSCSHEDTIPNPGKKVEEPLYCDFCNP
ncbi:MAG: hypothetical protein P8X57_02720 [Cyclobacteriaceae bacterium]